jgi:hypothetical protein
MDKQDKRVLVKRAKIIQDRLTDFYKKKFPDVTHHLTLANEHYADMCKAFPRCLEYHKEGRVQDALSKADYIAYYASHCKDNVKAYLRAKPFDWALAMKHFAVFFAECRNPFVDVATGDGITRDDLCFEIGPYTLTKDKVSQEVGPFIIKIDMGYCFAWSGIDHFRGFRAYAANPWVYKYGKKIHPHDMQWDRGTSNLMCTGEAGRQIWVAVKEGRIMDAVRYSEAMMSHFTDGAAYTPFLVFANQKKTGKILEDEGWTCAICNQHYHEDDQYHYCEVCDERYCEDCGGYCNGCDRYMCENHICEEYVCMARDCGCIETDCEETRGSYCDRCGDYNCNNHVFYCEECDRYYCTEHTLGCADCDTKVCVNCVKEFDGDWVCEDCYDNRVTEAEEAEVADD